MEETKVVALLDSLEEAGVVPWIDGGWGVDALVGRETRTHGDVDLVVEARDEARTIDVLQADAFVETPVWFTTDFHTVWGHDDGRVVDLHVIRIDEHGNGVFGEDVYPAAALQGFGRIGSRSVRCMTAEAQVAFRRGYDLRDVDHHDLALLHGELGVPRSS